MQVQLLSGVLNACITQLVVQTGNESSIPFTCSVIFKYEKRYGRDGKIKDDKN